MEQEDIKIAIIERFNSLQPEIQEIIINTDYEETLYEISKKYSLKDEQYKDLELNTTLVLLGNTHPDSYKEELIEDLKITEEMINRLIFDVNEKILNKVLPIIRQNFIDEGSLEIEPEKIVPVVKNTNTNYRQDLYAIGTKNKLPIDQVGEIDIATGKFLKGEITSVEYEKSIIEAVNQDATKANGIIKEINEKIINPKIEAMRAPEVKPEPVVAVSDVPMPPYYVKKEEIPSIKKEEIDSKPEEITIGDSDLYMDHGIEILSEDIKEVKQLEMAEKDKIKMNDVVVKQPEKSPEINIIANKLFETTSSKTVVRDYSLPKINTTIEPAIKMQGDAPAKPHDPYHEVI